MLKIVLPVVVILAMASAWWSGHGAERAAESAIREALADPDSAKFRNVKEISGIVCGEVNAKNRLGGYVGYVRFAIPTGAGPEAASIASNAKHIEIVNTFCP